MTTRVQVFVAEDHPLYLEAVESAIKHRPDLELVGSAADGRHALDEIRRLQPQVAVLGMRMSGLDGSEVLNAIVRDQIPTRVVFLSTVTESGLVYDMLARGAAGYVDKSSSSEEICSAIIAVSRGEIVLSPSLDGGVLRQIHLRAAEPAIKVTPREREVLRLVAEGLSASEIASRLFIQPSTVKSHLHNLYGKLGVAERAAAVAEGMRRGLLE
jgi:two-component system nitrate/nitrite response regulator NarL